MDTAGDHVIFYERDVNAEECKGPDGAVKVPEMVVNIGARGELSSSVDAQTPPWTYRDHDSCGRALGVFSAQVGTYDVEGDIGNSRGSIF